MCLAAFVGSKGTNLCILRDAPPSGENFVRPVVPEAGFSGPAAGFSRSEAGPCRPEAGLSREQDPEAGLSWARQAVVRGPLPPPVSAPLAAPLPPALLAPPPLSTPPPPQFPPPVPSSSAPAREKGRDER